MKVYTCNKCKYELSNFWSSPSRKGADDIINMVFAKTGTTSTSVPDAFYCRNKKCDRYGLLTKVAIVKEK